MAKEGWVRWQGVLQREGVDGLELAGRARRAPGWTPMQRYIFEEEVEVAYGPHPL